MVRIASIPRQVPCLGDAPTALAAWLLSRDYSAVYRSAIVDHVRQTGELAGAVAAGLLDAEDEGPASEVFADCLPDVPAGDPSWDRPDVFIDVETLLEFGRPAQTETDFDWEPPIPAELEPDDFDGPDAPDANWSRVRRPDPLRAAGIQPVSGGAPMRSGDGSIVDDEQEQEMRRWYRAHPLAEFNAVRPDQS